jgi:hypothetical protein
VVSIKSNKSVDAGGGRSDLGQQGGYVRIIKHSLRMLMGIAYDLPNFSDAVDRVVGLPSWADSRPALSRRCGRHVLILRPHFGLTSRRPLEIEKIRQLEDDAAVQNLAG